jgi:hypothetical protein
LLSETVADKLVDVFGEEGDVREHVDNKVEGRFESFLHRVEDLLREKFGNMLRLGDDVDSATRRVWMECLGVATVATTTRTVAD